MNEAKLTSLQKELTAWETKNQPGLVQVIATLVIAIFGAFRTGILDNNDPLAMQIFIIILLIIVSIFLGYIFMWLITPLKIQELRKEIADLEESRYRAFLFWD